MSARQIQYGACALLVQLMLGCTPGPAPDQLTNNATVGETEPDANVEQAQSRLIVAFGDSLYAGYQLDEGDGFAPELERRLEQAGIDAQVINAGVSGDTSAAGLARLGFTLDGLDRKPDLVILGLGGNDMLRGLSPDQTRRNLDAILTELDRRGIKAVLTGMMASPNMGTDYRNAFDAIFPELARKHGIALYPFFLDGVIGDQKLLLADGIHPNEDGVDLISGRVAPLVIEALQE